MAETKKQEDFNFTKSYVASYADIMIPSTFVKGKPKIMGPGPNARYVSTFAVDPTPVMKRIGDQDVDMSDFARLKREVIALLKTNKPGKQIKFGRLTEEQEAAGTHVEVIVPWKDGTKFADAQKAAGKNAEYARGKMLVKVSSKFQPALGAIINKQVVEFTTPESIAAAGKYFYSGAYLVPSVGLHFYKGDEGKPDGVSLYYNGVVFHKDGPRLGGTQKGAAERFSSYIGSITDEDPTDGANQTADEDEF